MTHIWKHLSETQVPKPMFSACTCSYQACSGHPKTNDAHGTEVDDVAVDPCLPQVGAVADDIHATLILCGCAVSTSSNMARNAPTHASPVPSS